MRAAKNKYTETFSEKDNLKKTWCLIKSVAISTEMMM